MAKMWIEIPIVTILHDSEMSASTYTNLLDHSLPLMVASQSAVTDGSPKITIGPTVSINQEVAGVAAPATRVEYVDLLGIKQTMTQQESIEDTSGFGWIYDYSTEKIIVGQGEFNSPLIVTRTLTLATESYEYAQDGESIVALTVIAPSSSVGSEESYLTNDFSMDVGSSASIRVNFTGDFWTFLLNEGHLLPQNGEVLIYHEDESDPIFRGALKLKDILEDGYDTIAVEPRDFLSVDPLAVVSEKLKDKLVPRCYGELDRARAILKGVSATGRGTFKWDTEATDQGYDVFYIYSSEARLTDGTSSG